MIKRIKKKSLGIVLTDRYVEVVYAEKTAGQTPKIRCGRTPLPEGFIRDGKIAIPGKVAALIVKLLKQEKIPLRAATVLVPDAQTVAQILDLPAEIPANMHKYIHTEIRYSPILAKRTPYSDFRKLGTDEQGKEKILIGMTTRECIDNLVQCLSLAQVEIRSLEMDFCALQRAIDSQILSGQKQKHLLQSALTGQTLTIWVYLNNKLDFLQRFTIPDKVESRPTVLERLAATKQFYEIEKGYSFHRDWNIMTFLDIDCRNREAWAENLSSLFGAAAKFYTPADLSQTIGQSGESVSFTGFGAAWKGIENDSSQTAPELLPRFFVEHYAWKRTARLTAIAAAVLIFVLYAGTLFFHSLRPAYGQTVNPTTTGQMIQLALEQEQIRREIDDLQKLRRITETLIRYESAFSPTGLLNEVTQKIPSSLQITRLEITEEGFLSLRGRAISFQTIHQFASALEQSERIEQATVEEARTSPSSSRVYDYRIVCRIRRIRPGEPTDAAAESK